MLKAKEENFQKIKLSIFYNKFVMVLKRFTKKILSTEISNQLIF